MISSKLHGNASKCDTDGDYGGYLAKRKQKTKNFTYIDTHPGQVGKHRAKEIIVDVKQLRYEATDQPLS